RELEEEHGSLIRGALAQRSARGASPANGPLPSTFLSLAGGMGEMIEALARAVEAAGGTIRLGAPIRAVTRGRAGARRQVQVEGDPAALSADDVVLCTPAFAAADALDDLDREMSARLREIPYVSTATILLGYARADIPHPLDASGLLIPKTE